MSRAITVRSFQKEDLEAISPQIHDEILIAAMPGIIEHLADQASTGRSLTMLYDGEPICCGGILEHWPGVGEGWLYVSDSIKDHRLSFHRTVWSILVGLCAAYQIRRLQVTVKQTNDTACRWIRRLGFVEEGTMPMYGPDGSTHIRYALFPTAGRVNAWLR